MTYKPEEQLMHQELPTCLKCGYEQLDLANFYDGEREWICPECGIEMIVTPMKEVVFNIIKKDLKKEGII